MANRKKQYSADRATHTSKGKTARSAAGQFRIIGGQWKGRKLRFVEVQGLRPSLDRVRETLFNWLAADIHGAKVLDLFAGSGALGLEALSRGAGLVQLVELNRKAAGQLANNIDLLTAKGLSSGQSCQLLNQDALKFVSDNQQAFNLVLLDPPFHQGIAQKACDLLAKASWLADGSYIYLETEQGAELAIAEHWQLLKDKKAGQLLYKLYQVNQSVIVD